MSAGYTGLPAEQREAYEAQMRSHERAYSGVREHAIAGADSDFDKPLSAGERGHQRALRDREGLQHAQVLQMRRGLRAKRAAPARAKPDTLARRARAGAAPGARAARGGAKKATSVIGTATGGSGNTVLYFIGVTLGLSLLYLLVAGKGSKAIAGIVGALTGGVAVFVAPKDPITSLEKALGASAVSSSGSSEASSAPAPSGGASGTEAPGTTTPTRSGASGAVAPTPAAAGASVAKRSSTSNLATHLKGALAFKEELEGLERGGHLAGRQGSEAFNRRFPNYAAEAQELHRLITR